MVSSCEKCDREDDNEMIQCETEECRKWIHYKCVRMGEREVARIKDYYCDDCERGGKLTKWKGKRATEEQKIMKEKDYYEVEEILDHKGTIAAKRKFLVRWIGYPMSQATWEPECNLDGA